MKQRLKYDKLCWDQQAYVTTLERDIGGVLGQAYVTLAYFQ